jgi:glycosyltransferase involved in cell wall biosynthesis
VLTQTIQKDFLEITEWWDKYIIDKQLSPHFFLYPAEIMLSKGFNVTVLTKRHPILEQSSDYNGIRIYRLPCILKVPYMLSIDFSYFLIKHLLQKRYALIHMHSLLPGEVTLALLTLKLRKTPVVFTSHFYTFHKEYKNVFKKIGSIMQNKGLKACAYERCVFHALTNFQATIYKLYGIKEENIALIPHGIDPKIFEVKRREDVRQKYGLKDVNILCVGNFSENKGQHLLVETMKGLITKYIFLKPHLKLVLVGRVFGNLGGKYLNLLKSYIQKYDLKENVIFIIDPPRYDLLQLYLNSDLFALPTAKEQFGLVFLEAMAAGLPLISTNISPVNEVLYHGNEALLCERNVNALTKCIETLIFDENLRKKMGSLAKRKVYEKYHLNEVKKRLWNLYENLLTG